MVIFFCNVVGIFGWVEFGIGVLVMNEVEVFVIRCFLVLEVVLLMVVVFGVVLIIFVEFFGVGVGVVGVGIDVVCFGFGCG